MGIAQRAWQRQGTRRAPIKGTHQESAFDGRTGAVRSVQGVELLLGAGAMSEPCSQAQLEGLARAYWRFTTSATLGFVRLRAGADTLALRVGRVKLIAFGAPEYELAGARGSVCWPIEGGLLVARAGHEDGGRLLIAVRCGPAGESSQELLDVEVRLENFYPALASRCGRRVYEQTQLRFHVTLTKLFLHRIARLELAQR